MPSIKPGDLTAAERRMLVRVMGQRLTRARIGERDVVAWKEPYGGRTTIGYEDTIVLGSLREKGLVRELAALGARVWPLGAD